MKHFLRPILSFALLAMTLPALSGADPTATRYPAVDCLGSAKPYPAPEGRVATPDSLIPVFVNHVGRHGARYLSSPKTATRLAQRLHAADSASLLTPLGKNLMKLTDYVIKKSANRWGALDSLGMAEQRGIASRMLRAYPRLFREQTVSAISSYSPRCVMSMYEFTHQLDRLDNTVEINTASGHRYSRLMRPFDIDQEYIDWVKSNAWEAPYDMLFQTSVPAAPARRLVKGDLSGEEAMDLSWDAYRVLMGLPAMGMAMDIERYFTLEELNALWACENLRHYLVRTATTLSSEPALIASDLLANLIETTDVAARGENVAAVQLRFGHAETLMPLLSLMRLPGCYYMTNYFDTVALHWKDFHVVPMAANLQMILFITADGKPYVRVDLNEQPVNLIPNSDRIYIPWKEARDYLTRCLPLHLQP